MPFTDFVSKRTRSLFLGPWSGSETNAHTKLRVDQPESGSMHASWHGQSLPVVVGNARRHHVGKAKRLAAYLNVH